MLTFRIFFPCDSSRSRDKEKRKEKSSSKEGSSNKSSGSSSRSSSKEKDSKSSSKSSSNKEREKSSGKGEISSQATSDTMNDRFSPWNSRGRGGERSGVTKILFLSLGSSSSGLSAIVDKLHQNVKKDLVSPSKYSASEGQFTIKSSSSAQGRFFEIFRSSDDAARPPVRLFKAFGGTETHPINSCRDQTDH